MPRSTEPKVRPRGGVFWYSFTFAGKRFRGSTGERDRGRAEGVLAAKWYEATRGAPSAPIGPLAGRDLASLSSLWLADLAAKTKERPRHAARHKLDLKYILLHFARASDVTDERWQEAMRALNADGLSWRSLQHATVTLRHVLRFAASVGAVTPEPAIRPPPNRLVARSSAPRRALTAAERDRVLRALRALGHDRAARIWTAMAYTGLRRGELAKLTLRWLDVGASVLRVPATAAKSGQEETIPLHSVALRAIRAEAHARGVKDKDAPVFGGFDVRKAWRAALKRARVDAYGLTPHHSARHTFGTLIAQISKGDVTAVQAAGRWRSLAMVQRYVHSSAARARAAMRRL